MSKRSRTRERRKEREQERRRKLIRNIIIGVVILVGIGLVIVIATNQPAEAPIPDDILERYNDIAVSQTTEGYYRLGSSDAPVRVEEYSSFSCTHCNTFHETTFPALLERVKAGEINFTFVPLQTGSVQNAEGAARTALCAGEQGRFWEMHDVLFDWHNLYVNNAFNNSRLSAAVDGLGLDSGQFNSCFNSSDTSDILTAAEQEGVNATPAVAVNDSLLDDASLETINEAIDAALAFAPPVETEDEPEETPEATAEAESTAEADIESTDEPEMEATEEMGESEEVEATDESEAQSADDAEATDEAETDEEPETEATDESES